MMLFIQIPCNSQTGLNTGAKIVPLIQSFTRASPCFESTSSLLVQLLCLWQLQRTKSKHVLSHIVGTEKM